MSRLRPLYSRPHVDLGKDVVQPPVYSHYFILLVCHTFGEQRALVSKILRDGDRYFAKWGVMFPLTDPSVRCRPTTVCPRPSRLRGWCRRTPHPHTFPTVSLRGERVAPTGRDRIKET